MLSVELDREAGAAVLEPDGALSEIDFETAAGKIDPYSKQHGPLNGIVNHLESSSVVRCVKQ